MRLPNYRAFFIGLSGRIEGPPVVIEATDDDGALQHAWALVDGHVIELWDCERFIGRLDPVRKAAL